MHSGRRRWTSWAGRGLAVKSKAHICLLDTMSRTVGEFFFFFIQVDLQVSTSRLPRSPTGGPTSMVGLTDLAVDAGAKSLRAQQGSAGKAVCIRICWGMCGYERVLPTIQLRTTQHVMYLEPVDLPCS